MPIAILEIPKNVQIDTKEAKALCSKVGDFVHDGLNVPDLEDKEGRVVRNDSEKGKITISFTIGPNEYPDFKGKEAFFPNKEQIELVGNTVLEMAQRTQVDVSTVVVEEWRDTTFILKEGEMSKPISPVSEDELKTVGHSLINPRIKLVLSPLEREDVSSSKEVDQPPGKENSQETVSGLSMLMKEILGQEIKIEVEYAESADTSVAVEFDCETQSGEIIPQKIRRFMTESSLFFLNSNMSTREGSAEVWVRQGEPDRHIFSK